MVGNIEIDFREIRPHDGDKRKGFEELICQLARREENQDAREFRRVEGGGGDGGVEAYWIFDNGTKHGYQAKYFLATKDIDWLQIDKSVKAALDQHPTTVKYNIALACDLTDRSGKKGRGKFGWEHWTTHKSKWEKWATTKGMTIEFIPWTKSEITDRLVASTANRGLVLYWFNAALFDKVWFQKSFERARTDLGERFQPDDHVEVWLARAFDGLARSPAYLGFLSEWFHSIPSTGKLASALSKFDASLDEGLIQDLENRCDELRSIGESVYNCEARPFPLPDWRNAIEFAFNAISPIREWLYGQDTASNDTIHRAARHALACLSEIGSYLDRTPIHLGTNNPHEIRVESDLRRVLIVVGEAGSGKSHIFADAVTASLSKNVGAVLLLGQNFPGQDIRREFLNYLDLANHDFETVLQALNAAGEAAQTRLTVLIDALNEAHTLRVWPDQLAGFFSDILRYEWLAIGLNLRPEYEDVLIPETVGKNSAHVTCRGIQSLKEQDQAATQYFEKRGITRPAVPWLTPEFSNFLFLKTCCDALQELGIKEFPRGLRGSLQVLRFYLDSIHSKLRRRFPHIDIPQGAVQNAIRQIAQSMARMKTDYVNSRVAIEICEDQFGYRGPNSTTSWFSVLASEGVFRLDHLFHEVNDDPFANVEDVYRFTYQRFSDHLIVQALLEKVDDIHDAFLAGGPLTFLLKQDGVWAWSSLWSPLAVQIPEKFIGKEMLDVLPEEIDGPTCNYTLFEAFEQSLLWRSSSAFSDRTLELFNSLSMESREPRFDIIVRLATLQDHPWNAEFLDRNLQSRPLTERDAFWTVHLNSVTGDDRHPLWELIHWSLRANLGPAETETLRLAATALAWTFTSSSRPLRDTATKALVKIFVTRPELISGVIERFKVVDDLYVVERVYAAVLGAITRGVGPKNIRATAQAVYQAIFARETPQLNINLRDFARGVVEYALQQGCLPKNIDIEKCRPPYRSEWPLHDTTEKEIDELAEKAGGKQILRSAYKWGGDFGIYTIPGRIHHFTDVPLNKPRPLNDEEREKAFKKQIRDWDTEKQVAFLKLEIAVREKGSSMRIVTEDNGDPSISFSYSQQAVGQVEKTEAELLALLNMKERKAFEQLMLPVLMPDRVTYEERRLPQFDDNFAKRWITKKAYKYGWNDRLFPNDQGHHGIGRQRPHIERIGKKYQWLALSELMARLSDNVWAINGWPERAMIYDHPATDWFVRDIEPSLLIDPVQIEVKESWWQALPLELEPIEDDGLRKWPFQDEPPDTSDWMDVVAPDGKPWLLLYGFFDVREDRSKKSVSLISFRRNIFVRVSTILIETDAVDAIISKLMGCRLSDPSGHETIDWTDGPFLCEYPWRNTWQSDYGIYEKGDIGNLSGIRYIRPVARHVWESHLDLSLQNGSSVCIPNPYIGKKLSLQINLSRPGEFIAESDGQVIFIDPTFGVSDSSAAFIDKGKFFDFLKGEGLECLWIVAGELNSWPSGHHGDYSCRSFASVYRWSGEKWIGDKWHNDESGSPNR